MKRIGLFILGIILSTAFAFSQAKPVITFKETTYDFGEIYESEGSVEHKFIFTNTGDAPLILNTAQPTCGCTTPSWTKEPVAPGGSGEVNVVFNPAARPGPFSKPVTIISNGGQLSLVIKGTVTPKRPAPEELYPIVMGDMRLKGSLVNFGTFAITETSMKEVEVFNMGKNPLTLKINNLPKYITAVVTPSSIPANTAGKITFSYDAPAAKKYGSNVLTANVVVNNDSKAAANNKLQILATVLDKVNSGNAANAPKLNVAPMSVDFGKMSDPNASKTQILRISNSGKSELYVRDIQENTQSLLISMPKSGIKPGEIVEIKLTVQPKKVVQETSGIITLITNDPNNMIKEVRFTVKP